MAVTWFVQLFRVTIHTLAEGNELAAPCLRVYTNRYNPPSYCAAASCSSLPATAASAWPLCSPRPPAFLHVLRVFHLWFLFCCFCSCFKNTWNYASNPPYIFLPWSLINLTQRRISSDCPFTLTLFCLFTPSSFFLYVSFFFYYDSFIFLSITFYSDSCFILSAFLQQFCAYSLFHLIIPYSSCFVYRCSSDSKELVNELADHRIRVRFVAGTNFFKLLDLVVCDAVSLGVHFPTLRRNLVLNREGYSSRSRMLDPEKGSTIFLPNVMNNSPNATTTQLGRTPPRRPDISHKFISYPQSPVRVCELSSLISSSFSRG